MKALIKIEDTEQYDNLSIREVMEKVASGEIGTPVHEHRIENLSSVPKLRVVQGGKKD